MYKIHPRNNYAFDKNGIKRAGYNTELVKVEQKRESATDVDRENRLRVLRQIEEAVSKKEKELDKINELERIVEELASDDGIRKQFDYLIRNGLDLKKIFKSWYESSQKNKNNPFLGER